MEVQDDSKIQHSEQECITETAEPKEWTFTK